MLIRVPYGYSFQEVEIPDAQLAGVLTTQNHSRGTSGGTLVKAALSNPIGSPRLKTMAARASRIIIITSDHTRPLPSHITLPYLLREIREGNPLAKITILVATGLHRAPTPEELTAKFGKEVTSQERFVCHDANDYQSLIRLQDLPSGAPFWVNRLALEADLLVAEGFIEPHFMAGFSGGRKSVLPGISGKETILFNHSATMIDHSNSHSGVLKGNIIHEDMAAAAEQVELKFILNVALDEQKEIVGAFAGHPVEAFERGAASVNSLTKVPGKKADIIVAGNGGYPLDQNLYQLVKCMYTGARSANEGAVIIAVGACQDGIGGDSFYRMLVEGGGPGEILAAIRKTPPLRTELDQWQVQIFARILMKHRVIVVTDGVKPEILHKMGLDSARNPNEALEMAFQYKGSSAKVVVIPNGAGVIIKEL